MARIISVGKDNPLKSLWRKFKSLDLFTKLFIITIILLAISTPFIVNNYQIFKSRGEAPEQLPPFSNGPQFVPDEILLKFKNETAPDQQEAILKENSATISAEIPQIKVKVLKVNEHARDAVIEALSHNPAVEFAEKNGITQAMLTPNDTSFSLEWGMKNIQASAAWDITTGSSAVAIAVLDTGIDSTHPDLAGKITNSVNFSASATANDLYGHGTHVAGIAAAVTNNSLGVAGLGYNSNLMNVKVLGDDGSGTYSSLSQGMVWAADNGAKVINMSLGGSSASSTLEDAVNYAWNKGVVVVAAAGNSASNVPFYPAYYQNAIAVAATDQYDQRAVFSNYGDWVDVGAPGYQIYSSVPTSGSVISDPSGYKYLSGTSMASPHVAGLAALVLTKVNDTNGNGFLNDEARACIQNTAEKTVSGIGSGRVNAYGAVTCSPVATGSIAGTVRDSISGAPISGAMVTDMVRTTSTDSSGVYTITGVPPGTTYNVTASALGYSNSTWIVSVGASSTTSLNFNLAPLSAPSPTPFSTPTPTPKPISTPTPTPIDTTLPLVTISIPSFDGYKLSSKGSERINASAQDTSGIFEMKIYLDSTLLKTCSLVNSCSTNLSSQFIKQLVFGPHNITVTATDNSTNKNTGIKIRNVVR